MNTSGSQDELQRRVMSLSIQSVPTKDFARHSPELEASEPELPVVVELAAALMERIPALKSVRLRLVPSFMSEDEFWARYLSVVRFSIIDTFDNS